ncbi:hypothetical protein MKX08_000180 [Trichoderma sp. CBMAI-0020]|nr:hypothetical protein MKX08_000180 [Trichoderma sp. CBMAI-0020]
MLQEAKIMINIIESLDYGSTTHLDSRLTLNPLIFSNFSIKTLLRDLRLRYLNYRVIPYCLIFNITPASYTSIKPSPISQLRGHLINTSTKSLYFFNTSHQMGSKQESPLLKQWMDNLLSLIYNYIDPFNAVKAARRTFKPVQIV